jgi:3'-phosphoadenosine 5'-phosphosulfate sulfotransferase (PAPS reductase)/FAD synthetase
MKNKNREKQKLEDTAIDKWWSPIKKAFAGISLKSLKVKCPQCKEIGLVTTRWVKGPALKPIYILHIKWEKVRKVCEISEEQSKNIRGTVSIFKSDIKKLLESRKSYVLFSGGNDSLATLVYLKGIIGKGEGDLTAIYVDTTAGLPANTKYVKKVCKYLGVNLKIVRPKIDYFTLAEQWGIPSFKYRWCCRELKIKPIEEYLNKIKEPKVVFDGIRAAESNLRKQYIPIWYHPSFKCLSVSPIFYWSNEQVISYVNSNGIPKTFLHSLGTSTECWCGAYKTKSDFQKLYELDREMFFKLVEVEKKNKSGYTFLYENGKMISLLHLEKELTIKEKNKID